MAIDLPKHSDSALMLEDTSRKMEMSYRDAYQQHLKKFGPPPLTAEHVYELYLLRKQYNRKPLFTGVEWWDNFAGPLRHGNVYVLAGYPGAGKSTLAINLSWSMAKHGLAVWYYCLELTPIETMEVLAGHILGKAELFDSDWPLAYATIQPTKFRFHEQTGYQNWEQHLAGIGKAVRMGKLDFVVIDNLSFLTRVKSNTFEAENVCSARIKALAQECDIPILVIHHLRKPESDSSEPEPTAHSMRGSGAILADASDAFILHHPLDPDPGRPSRYPVGYLLSGKPRWGRGGKIYVRLDGATRSYGRATSAEYQGGNRSRRERKYE